MDEDRFVAALNSEEFYNAMQEYRMAPIVDQNAVAAAFSRVKLLIITYAIKSGGSNGHQL